MASMKVLPTKGSAAVKVKRLTGADDLALMRRIDELDLKWPFYGSRRMVSNSTSRAARALFGALRCPKKGDRSVGVAPQYASTMGNAYCHKRFIKS